MIRLKYRYWDRSASTHSAFVGAIVSVGGVEGVPVGCELGKADGAAVGTVEGVLVGCVGAIVVLGGGEGVPVGCELGKAVADGELLGKADGTELGKADGCADGEPEGETEMVGEVGEADVVGNEDGEKDGDKVLGVVSLKGGKLGGSHSLPPSTLKGPI